MAMQRLATLLAGLALLTAPAVAQEDSGEQQAPDTEVSTEGPDESEANDDVELLDDPELDIQGFDPTDDDDFVPSEEIPADEPIAFPTDI